MESLPSLLMLCSNILIIFKYVFKKFALMGLERVGIEVEPVLLSEFLLMTWRHSGDLALCFSVRELHFPKFFKGIKFSSLLLLPLVIH